MARMAQLGQDCFEFTITGLKPDIQNILTNFRLPAQRSYSSGIYN